MDVAEAQLWYEAQRRGLGAEFNSEVSRVIERLSDTPLIYQSVFRNVRRAIIHRFPYLVWFQVIGERVIVLACTHGKQDPKKVKARF